MLEGNLLAAHHFAGIRAGIICADAVPRGATQVILRLHVLQVQREAKNVLIRNLLGQSRRRPLDSAEGSTGTQHNETLQRLTPRKMKSTLHGSLPLSLGSAPSARRRRRKCSISHWML